jgi:signal transduction histidine kinase
VPEVIFFIVGLEHSALTGQARQMWPLFKKLLTPMNFAAYIAWAAIGVEIFAGQTKGTGLIPESSVASTTMALHVAYLACFLSCVLVDAKQSPLRCIYFALAMAVIALVICAISRYSSAPILLIVASAVFTAFFSPSRLVIAFVIINACLYCIYRFIWQASSPFISVSIYSSFQLFAMLMAWYSHQAEKRRDDMILLNADLIATRSLLTETVRDSERLRLSRELHDVAGHKLTALKLNLAALVRDPQFSANESIHTCANLADELLGDIRGVVQQMRMHDGLDLQASIEKMAAPFPRPRVQLAIDDNARHAPMQQAEVLLRTVQEALTNAARHSQAQALWVVLQRQEGRWQLRIRDDGRMANDWQIGNGLQGMGERLENLGGGLRCEHASTGGMQLEAWLPVNA